MNRDEYSVVSLPLQQSCNGLAPPRVSCRFSTTESRRTTAKNASRRSLERCAAKANEVAEIPILST